VARDYYNQIQDVEMTYYVTIPDGAEERLVHRFLMRYLFRFEAEHLLARVGFGVEVIYADFDRSLYGSVYPGELIIVARKETSAVTASPQDQDRDMNNACARYGTPTLPFWDQRYGEGNDFQRQLIGPASERLLALQPGERVLEIACGNGAFARRMAERACTSWRWITAPYFWSGPGPERIRPTSNIAWWDATEPAQLAALGARCYDAAVCSMGLMDMVVIEPLLMALPKLLAPNGRFVFWYAPMLQHPGGSTKLAEEEIAKARIVTTYALKITRYITPSLSGSGHDRPTGAAILFHRPLSVLLGACFAAGFVLDGLEEPVFDAATRLTHLFTSQIIANFRLCWCAAASPADISQNST
jgi:SAM-dependent methyltransferase